MFAVLELAQRGSSGGNSAWYLVTALFIFPSILFAPVNGAISNGLPKRLVLTGSAAFCLLVLAAFTIIGHARGDAFLLVALVLVAAGAAIYNPTRYALLPAAAQDTGIPLTRVNGWIELGAAVAIVGGVILAVQLQGRVWCGFPTTLVIAVILSLAGALTALATRFPSDVCRPEPPSQAVAGFFRDAARIWREPAARFTALGLAGFLALITAGSGAVVMHVLSPEPGGARSLPIQAMLLVSVGAGAGSWLAGRVPDPRRALGLVPVGAAGLLLSLAGAALMPADDPLLSAVPSLFLGIMSGLANVPLRAAFQSIVPADARGNAMAVTGFLIYVLTTFLSLLLVALARLPLFDAPWKQLIFLAGLTGIGTALACWAVGRETGLLLRSLWRPQTSGPRAPAALLTEALEMAHDQLPR